MSVFRVRTHTNREICTRKCAHTSYAYRINTSHTCICTAAVARWSGSPPPGNNSKSRVINPSSVCLLPFPYPLRLSLCPSADSCVCVCVYVHVRVQLCLCVASSSFSSSSTCLSFSSRSQPASFSLAHAYTHTYFYPFVSLSLSLSFRNMNTYIRMHVYDAYCCKLLPTLRSVFLLS